MKYIKPTYNKDVIETSDIILISAIGGESPAKLEATGTTSAKVALRKSSKFGLKWKIACLTVLKKLDYSLIACTFLPCNPTYFLI